MMGRIEKIIFRGIFGVIALIATYVFLFFYNVDIPLNWLTILFSFAFGWQAIIIILLITLF